MIEDWAGVREHPDYLVSSQGNVVNKTTGYRLTPTSSIGGRTRVSLTTYGKTLQHNIDALVWTAFRGIPPSSKVIRHRDGDMTNNVLSNLYLDDKQSRPKLRVRDVDTGEVFETMAAAARKIGAKPMQVCYAVRTKEKRVLGHRFEIVTP